MVGNPEPEVAPTPNAKTRHGKPAVIPPDEATPSKVTINIRKSGAAGAAGRSTSPSRTSDYMMEEEGEKEDEDSGSDSLSNDEDSDSVVEIPMPPSRAGAHGRQLLTPPGNFGHDSNGFAHEADDVVALGDYSQAGGAASEAAAETNGGCSDSDSSSIDYDDDEGDIAAGDSRHLQAIFMRDPCRDIPYFDPATDSGPDGLMRIANYLKNSRKSSSTRAIACPANQGAAAAGQLSAEVFAEITAWFHKLAQYFARLGNDSGVGAYARNRDTLLLLPDVVEAAFHRK
jgi:hypothetical protein